MPNLSFKLIYYIFTFKDDAFQFSLQWRESQTELDRWEKQTDINERRNDKELH